MRNLEKPSKIFKMAVNSNTSQNTVKNTRPEVWVPISKNKKNHFFPRVFFSKFITTRRVLINVHESSLERNCGATLDIHGLDFFFLKRYLPSLVKVDYEDNIISKTGQSMWGWHSYNERKYIVDKSIEGLEEETNVTLKNSRLFIKKIIKSNNKTNILNYDYTKVRNSHSQTYN